MLQHFPRVRSPQRKRKAQIERSASAGTDAVRKAEEAGGGPAAGQGHAMGWPVLKTVRPAYKRELVAQPVGIKGGCETRGPCGCRCVQVMLFLSLRTGFWMLRCRACFHRFLIMRTTRDAFVKSGQSHGPGGWGGRDRTFECWNQNPVPYRLATPQIAKGRGPYSRPRLLSTRHTIGRRPAARGVVA